MKKVSNKQAQKNAVLAKIKKTKPDVCIFCQTSCSPFVALCHIFPKGIYGQYYTEVLNVWKGHEECHTPYDNGTKEYRATFTHIVALAERYATEQEIFRHFGI